MSLKNREQNLTYLRIKNGKFYIGKDLEKPYDELEGRVVGLRYKDEEYEGKPIRKLLITLQDGDQRYQFGVGVETTSYSSVISFLKNVDLSRPVALHPKEQPIEGSENKRRSILVSQAGKFAKSYFTKENTHGLPAWEVVTVGKKKVTDKSAFLDFLENFVVTDLIPQISTDVEVSAPTEAPVAEAKASVNKASGLKEAPEAADKLPWED